MKTLKRPVFQVSIDAPGGGGYSTTKHSVNACIVEGLNHARYLLNAAKLDGRARPYVAVRVEVLCGTCFGDGKHGNTPRRGPVRCKDCDGGNITSPISGPTAIVLRVCAEGGVSLDEDAPAGCECGERREG